MRGIINLFLICLSILLFGVSIFANQDILELDEVLEVSQRVWETSASSSLIDPTEELCRSAATEVLVRGRAIEAITNLAKLRRCRSYVNKNSRTQLNLLSLRICDRIADKKVYTHSYYDDENRVNAVFDSKEFDCIERATQILGLKSTWLDCRRTINQRDDKLLPTSHGNLQRMISCNMERINKAPALRTRQTTKAMKRQQPEHVQKLIDDFIESNIN